MTLTSRQMGNRRSSRRAQGQSHTTLALLPQQLERQESLRVHLPPDCRLRAAVSALRQHQFSVRSREGGSDVRRHLRHDHGVADIHLPRGHAHRRDEGDGLHYRAAVRRVPLAPERSRVSVYDGVIW